MILSKKPRAWGKHENRSPHRPGVGERRCKNGFRASRPARPVARGRCNAPRKGAIIPCSELVTSAYRQLFQDTGIALASARRECDRRWGDWADRLVPDILRALEKDQPVIIRNLHAIRPWQHVLEPLSGYLTLAEHLYVYGQGFAEGWNFGPRDDDARPVQ